MAVVLPNFHDQKQIKALVILRVNEEDIYTYPMSSQEREYLIDHLKSPDFKSDYFEIDINDPVSEEYDPVLKLVLLAVKFYYQKTGISIFSEKECFGDHILEQMIDFGIFKVEYPAYKDYTLYEYTLNVETLRECPSLLEMKIITDQEKECSRMMDAVTDWEKFISSLRQGEPPRPFVWNDDLHYQYRDDWILGSLPYYGEEGEGQEEEYLPTDLPTDHLLLDFLDPDESTTHHAAQAA